MLVYLFCILVSIFLSRKLNKNYRVRYFVLLTLMIVWDTTFIKTFDFFGNLGLGMTFLTIFLYLLFIPFFLITNEVFTLVENIRKKLISGIILSVLMVMGYLALSSYTVFLKEHDARYILLKSLVLLLVALSYCQSKRVKQDAN
mgnify:FL=1